MASKRYLIVDPPTIELLNERIYNSLTAESHQFTLTGERIFDDVAVKRGNSETRKFDCVVFSQHPLPVDDYFVVATVFGTNEAIRIELRKGNLEATVMLNG